MTTLTIACPEQHIDRANQYAMAKGWSIADGLTYRAPRYERDGVQYSVTSVLLEQFAADPFEECTRPEWDADEVIDLVAANEVIALLDVHSYDPEVPVTPDPDKLTVITGPEPLVALAHMGLVLMETQEDVI
jgi:hypothetical protein